MNVEKAYFLQCGETTFKFTLETLLQYSDWTLTKMLLSNGCGKINQTEVDYDEKIMSILVREIKNPLSVDWRELSRSDLCLAIKYARSMKLFDITDKAECVLNLRNALRGMSADAIQNCWNDVSQYFKAPSETITTLTNLIFATRVWFCEDLNPPISPTPTHSHSSRSSRSFRSGSGSGSGSGYANEEKDKDKDKEDEEEVVTLEKPMIP
jgi:hypothetical protein